MQGIPSEQLAHSKPEIIHPHEIQREYIENGGIWFFRAQNLRPLLIDDTNKVFISDADAKLLPKNHLKYGDVVITRTGANRGMCAYFESREKAVASSHTFIVRSERWNHGFLVAFLNCDYGRLQIDKGVYGAAQPEVAPYYLQQIWIPDLSPKFQAEVESKFTQAAEARQHANDIAAGAQDELVAALGLAKWSPAEPLTYTRRASEALAAHRLDSEYFAPRVKDLLRRLSAGGRTVRDAAPPRIEKFSPSKDGTFRYIEISDVRSDGTADSGVVAMQEAPSRATWYVRAGDVITSTVRPNRRLSALVIPEQDGCVASSGFVVLKPKEVPGEVLLTYLRLPVFCELMDLHTSASLYPAISDRDLLALPFPNIAPAATGAIVAAVRSAHDARRRANLHLEKAKRAVEIAIEESEAAALKYLKGN